MCFHSHTDHSHDGGPEQHIESDGHDTHPSFWKSKAAIVMLVFAGVGGFFLITEHWAHLYGILPFLLILACPLMHIFMHHGHGHHHHEEQPAGGPPSKPASDQGGTR